MRHLVYLMILLLIAGCDRLSSDDNQWVGEWKLQKVVHTNGEIKNIELDNTWYFSNEGAWSLDVWSKRKGDYSEGLRLWGYYISADETYMLMSSFNSYESSSVSKNQKITINDETLAEPNNFWKKMIVMMSKAYEVPHFKVVSKDMGTWNIDNGELVLESEENTKERIYFKRRLAGLPE